MRKRARNTIYKILLFAIAVYFCFAPISGGSNIGTRLLVNAIGIDTVSGGVRATVEAVGKESKAIIGNGDTVKLAINNISSKEGSYAELAHCGIIVLGGEVTTEEAFDALTALLSEGKMNAGVSVIVADGSAEDFMNESVKLGNDGISDYITYLDQYIHIGVEKLITFLGKLGSKSAAAGLPILKLQKRDSGTGEGMESNSSEGGGAQPESGGDEETEVILTHRVKTYGEKELVLSEKETRGYDWLISKQGNGIESLPNFHYEGKDYGIVSADIDKKSGSVHMTGAYEAEYTLNIRLHVKSRDKALSAYLETKNKAYDIYEQLKRQFAESIAADAQAFVDFCKNERIDLLGVCNQVYKYRTSELLPPAEMLEAVKVNVVPKVSVY